VKGGWIAGIFVRLNVRLKIKLEKLFCLKNIDEWI